MHAWCMHYKAERSGWDNVGGNLRSSPVQVEWVYVYGWSYLLSHIDLKAIFQMANVKHSKIQIYHNCFPRIHISYFSKFIIRIFLFPPKNIETFLRLHNYSEGYVVHAFVWSSLLGKREDEITIVGCLFGCEWSWRCLNDSQLPMYIGPTKILIWTMTNLPKSTNSSPRVVRSSSIR